MGKEDLVLKQDNNGEFFVLSTDFTTKNHQSDSSNENAGHIQDPEQLMSLKK